MPDQICVCEIETKYGEEVAVKAFMSGTFRGMTVTGHWSNGIACCPHFGNTCGNHPENDQQQPLLPED